MVSRALAQTASALAVALVALLLAFSRKGTSCQTQTASSLCQQIETASSAVQGLRALQELCDKCKKGKDNYGSDPCSSLPQPTLEEVFSKGRSRFSALEQELVEISQKIIATLQEVGDNTEKKRVLGAMLLDVNKNLENVRKLQSLNFDPQALKQGLVKHKTFFDDAAKKLEMRFEAHGHDHAKSLHMILHNPSDESVTVKLPAGALFAPVKRVGGQNLALKDQTEVRVVAKEAKKVWLWAYCANSNKASPYGQLEATDYVLDCDLSNQSSVWRQTQQFEHWDSVLMAHFKLADHVLSLGS